MQELIEELRQTRDEGESEYKTAYNLAIAIANQYLEKEKEQIMKAYKDCHDYMHIYGLDSEKYFNDEYKNK